MTGAERDAQIRSCRTREVGSALAMTAYSILSPLAQSLALCRWEIASLEAHLREKLPPRQRSMATRLAQTLVGLFPGPVAPDAKHLLRYLTGSTQGKAIVAYAQKHKLAAPLHPLAPPAFLPTPLVAAFNQPALATTGELAEFLGITPEQLVRFADLRALSSHSADPFGPHYLTRGMPKSSGGLRLIEEPRPFLKTLQRRLLSGILNRIPPHPAACGFVRGRSCLTAATRHAGEAMLVGFDLADFFASVDFARIYAIFRSLGYPPTVARNLSGLCSVATPPTTLHANTAWQNGPHRHRHLPQGAPTSPALANLSALALDRRLAGLARSLGATYTRYADDLTFSGDAHIKPILLRAVPQIVAAEGFALNPVKTRAQAAHQRQTTTGIVVNAHLNLPRAEYDQLKSILHHLAQPADPRRHDPTFRAHLLGRIGWLAQVNPSRGARLRDIFDAI